MDGIRCHKAFRATRNLGFPLLHEFEPKGAVARAYSVYDVEIGYSQRASFAVYAQGIIRGRYVSPIGVNPGADGILNSLASLQTEKGVFHGRY